VAAASRESVLAERLSAQMLAGPPARDPVSATQRLLAIQAQDQRAARLAIRARSAGLTAVEVDRALTDDRSLLITWLGRGTLHLVCSPDYAWLHALTAPPSLTGNARRLRQEGVSPGAAYRALAVIEHSLDAEGPLTRAQLGERLAVAGVRTRGQALVHLLMLAGLRGLVVRGPMLGGEHGYTLVRDWLGEPERVDRAVALGELARRYLAGHAPASERDLARWAGVTLRDARAGLASIGSELEVRGDGLIELGTRAVTAGLPPPRLLGAFDPVLLGWTSRRAILESHEREVVRGGVLRAFALVRGRAAGIWRLRAGKVALEPFHDLAPADVRALEADADDVARFLDGGRGGR
jgi:hypothetical protein